MKVRCDTDNKDGTGKSSSPRTGNRHLNVEAVAQVREVTPGTEDLNVEAVAQSASGDSRDGRAGTRLGRRSTGGTEHVQG